MKTTITLLFLALFLNAAALADESFNEPGARLSGIVTDKNLNPLPHVHLGLVGTRHGTSTNDDGTFMLDGIPAGLYILGASMVGHEDHRQEVRVPREGDVHLAITLHARVYHMDQVNIIAERRGIFERVPGAASYIGPEKISLMNPLSGNEVFRRSPGVHVVDEEGVGLRANIGIRGLDPDRSRSVLILEDGIPVSLAPYGEPEMYYTPAMDRMSAVEILKGSGSILYGPQTIGGVINYITSDPPLEPAGAISLRGAEGGFFTGLVSFGNTYENTGYQVNYLRKQADSIGSTTYMINDLTARIRTRLGTQSSLDVKMGVYDESSNATYVGLTQAMYDAGGAYDFKRIAPDDLLHIRRYSLSVRHHTFLGKHMRLTNTAYGYTTTRNWQRQDFSYNSFDAEGRPAPRPSNYTGVTWGDETVDGGAIHMRNSTGNRNRQFEVAGFESRLATPWMLGSYRNELTAGGRILHERAYEQRVNGQLGNASSGTLQDDEIRTGLGGSAFIHNRIDLSYRLSFTAGFRMENFRYERDIRRGRFMIDGKLHTRDTLLVAGSSLRALIPGAGFNLGLGRSTTLFGGVHRGFAPPRVKDAVSNGGYVYHLDAEKSWSHELGLRSKTASGVSWELTGFLMDFSNQVIPVAESAGGAGTGSGLVNGGSTIHRGLEAALTADISSWWGSDDYTLEWDGSLTWVDSRFNSDRFQGTGAQTVNIKGNKTPYAPEWLIFSTLSFRHRVGLSASLSANHTGAQFTDIHNTITASANGRSGKMAPYTLIHANLAWEISGTGATFSLSGRNLTNKRYIVSRRPQGIRTGLPRMLTFGLNMVI